jgi:hypothetical protein
MCDLKSATRDLHESAVYLKSHPGNLFEAFPCDSPFDGAWVAHLVRAFCPRVFQIPLRHDELKT